MVTGLSLSTLLAQTVLAQGAPVDPGVQPAAADAPAAAAEAAPMATTTTEAAPPAAAAEEPSAEQPAAAIPVEETAAAGAGPEASTFEKTLNFFRPYFILGLSQARADGENHVRNDSPPVETVLDTRMPFTTEELGFNSRWLSLTPTDTLRIRGDWSLRHAKSYPFGEGNNDLETRLDGSGSYFLSNDGWSLEGTGYFEAGWMEREWPSLAFPSGRRFDGGAAVGPRLVNEWVDGRLRVGLNLHSLAYYKENLGYPAHTEGARFVWGFDLDFRKFRNQTEYAPIVSAGIEGTVGTHESPLPDERDVTDGGIGGTRVTAGVTSGPAVSNLAFKFTYFRETLEGFNTASWATGTLSVAPEGEWWPRFAATIGAGWNAVPNATSYERRNDQPAFSGTHYYRIDDLVSVDVLVRAPKALLLGFGPFVLDWGMRGTLNKYKDNEWPGEPTYLQRGAELFAKVAYAR